MLINHNLKKMLHHLSRSNRFLLGNVRNLSVRVTSTEFIRQGGLLQCDLSHLSRCNLNVTSMWQDHCEISYDEHSSFNITVLENEESNLLILNASDSVKSDHVSTINISVPEYFNVTIAANDLNLTMPNKVLDQDQQYLSHRSDIINFLK